MRFIKSYFLLITFLLLAHNFYAGEARILLQRGWNELVKDNDTEALKYFDEAYETARTEKDTVCIAEALLNIGICTYSISFTEGLEYCFKAMAEYQKLEQSRPAKALEGRSRCLQLISTINSRQGKYKESIALSREAMAGFATENDTTGYLGLIYNSLGIAYSHLNLPDSSEYYHRLALDERLKTKNFTYLPGSYLSVAEIEISHGNKTQSKIYLERAFKIADSTGNRQSQVSSLLGIGKWYLFFEKDNKQAEFYFLNAKEIAKDLSDKSFYLNSLDQIIILNKQHGNYKQAILLEEEKAAIKDTLNSWEKQKAIQSLEMQFNISEKDRQLKLVQKENDIASLTNYLLWVVIASLLVIVFFIFLFLRRINKRDKQLLITKESLVKVLEEQKKLKEQQMQNELEFKESQLSAMTIQMLQKNELMQELKNQMDGDQNISKDNSLNKIITKGLNHDKEWKDFNTHFESINKNFYSRLKLAYPEISPNDLKICALIKLNLSIKEMAGILNISPDSVKTARYRLRRKLQLNTEDNLTDFILTL